MDVGATRTRWTETMETTMLFRIFVLPLALTLLVGTTPFKPVYAQQDQIHCPQNYHEVPPDDALSLFWLPKGEDYLHCESNGPPPHHHIHGPHGPHGAACRQVYLLACRCIKGEHPSGEGCSPCSEVGTTTWCVDY